MRNVSLLIPCLAVILSNSGCKLAPEKEYLPQKELFEIINESKKCEKGLHGVECNFAVGDFFKVSIADVGSQSAGIHFMKSNADMPLYASYGTSHGCVIVNRFKGFKGDPEWVFISPKNGKVYKGWQECGEAL